jgi:hypothetical protein
MAVYITSLMPTTRSSKWPYDSAAKLLADTTEELDEFAGRLFFDTMARKDYPDAHYLNWKQHPLTCKEHYDVTATMRAKAIKLGAKEIPYREIVAVTERKRKQGRC